MALSMKQKYERIELSKLPDEFKSKFVQIKAGTENFDPDFVDIYQKNFDTLYGLTEKKFPEAIKTGGTVTKTKPATRKKPVAKKKATKRTVKPKSKFKVGDLVYHKEHKTVGIVRLGEDRGELKTDADGMVNVDMLEHFDPKKHKNYGIGPSQLKEYGDRIAKLEKKAPVKKVIPKGKGVKMADDMDVLVDRLTNSMDKYNNQKEFVADVSKHSGWIASFLHLVWGEYWELSAKERDAKTADEWRYWIADVKDIDEEGFTPKSRGMKKKSELKGYSKSISEATGVTDQKVLDEIEDIMRNVIFHSTLDWQSKKEFNDGAKEAYEIYKQLKKDGIYDKYPIKDKGKPTKRSSDEIKKGLADIQVEECRKILNEAGYTLKQKKSADGKKTMKRKVVRQERAIIKDKVDDTFTTVMKDISGSEDKDKKYKEMQVAINEMKTLMTKLFNHLNNLAEDNSVDKVKKINSLLKNLLN